MFQPAVSIAHHPGNKYITIKGRGFTKQIDLVFAHFFQIVCQAAHVGVMQSGYDKIVGHAAGFKGNQIKISDFHWVIN